MISPDPLSSAGTPAAASPKRRIHWPSVAQLAFSLSGIMLLWGQGLALATGIFYLPLTRPAGISPPALAYLSAACFGVGALFLPSAFYAFRRLQGRHTPLTLPRAGRLTLWLAPLLYLAALGVGLLRANFILLDVLARLLAAALPIYWLLSLAGRRLQVAQSGQRRWGLVAVGLGLSPLLSILIEVLLMLAIGGIFMLWASQNPQSMVQLENLGRRLLFSAGNPTATRHVLTRLLQEYPLLQGGILTLAGVFTPLVEEICKPLGVWLLAHKEISPREGLLAGMISGGMFALMESAFNQAQNTAWVGTMLGRAGTSLMHIAATGLVGYALARAWQERRYLQLGASYLLAVLLHGLWNIAVLSLAGNMLLHADASRWGAVNFLSVLALSGVILICLWIVLHLAAPRAEILFVQEETHGLADNPD